MKMEVTRYSIDIIPENETDEAYIEEVLGLKNKDDFVKAIRVAPFGLDHALAYIKLEKIDV